MAAGNAVLAVFRHRKNGGPGSAGARLPCAAGAAAALLLAAAAHAQQPGEGFRDCPRCPEMVMLPAGEFMMGSPDSGIPGREGEGPLHRVAIPRPFAVGKYPVTTGEYRAFLRANPAFRAEGFAEHEAGYGDRYPALGVNWHGAKAYAAWLSRETGRAYRLLSESEWEYAARAGTTTAYPWGDDLHAGLDPAELPGIIRRAARDGGELRDFLKRESGSPFAPVGVVLPANGFGLHDMHGNAREWVEDCLGGDRRSSYSYEGAAPPDGTAWLADGEAWDGYGLCDFRRARGGLFTQPFEMRSAYRSWFRADAGAAHKGFRSVGFRVARTD